MSGMKLEFVTWVAERRRTLRVLEERGARGAPEREPPSEAEKSEVSEIVAKAFGWAPGPTIGYRTVDTTPDPALARVRLETAAMRTRRKAVAGDIE